MPQHGVVVAGVQAGITAEDGDVWLSFAVGQIQRKVKVEEFGSSGIAIGGGGRKSHHQDPVRSRPIKGKLSFEGRGAAKAGRAVRDGGRALL